MSEPPMRRGTVPHQPTTLREDSSKSTASTNGPTDTSSTHQQQTPRTPFTPATQSPSQAYFRVPASPRAGSMPNAEPSSKAAKVAIPRLKRSLESQESGSKPGGRHRVTHACEPCRHRKTKCSGERPACRHCQDFKIQCYYADGKRDRVKKQFGSMTEKVADYERLLKDLATRASSDDADLIKTTLEQAAQLEVDETLENATLPSVELDIDAEASGAESEASGAAGSTGALDRTEEDFTREGAKTTGFMGKNSDVTWLQRLRQENKYGDSSQINPSDPNDQRLRDVSGSSLRARGSITANLALPEADSGFAIQDSSYHLNDLSISTYEAVDAYEMPTQEHAQTLFMTYMTRVHPTFPIVGRINLQNQFAKFLVRPMSRPPPKWLAIVNLVFAIASKYSHLIQAEWQADDRDHLIYFTRARMLSVDSETIFNHPDLQMIQILGLTAYYLLAIDQVNRSWNITGWAIRAATALGLNMRNDSANLSDDLKEIRYRVWWSLYTLEHRLCSMTGRVNCILDDHCTTPLPVPILEEEFETEQGKKLLNKEHQQFSRAPLTSPRTSSVNEGTSSTRSESKHQDSRSPSSQQSELDWAKEVQPNTALYFLHLVQLCRLTQKVFHNLYNPVAVLGRWSDIQASIGNLNQQLEHWYRQLPAAFDFRRKQRDRDFYEARLGLGFFYYAARQMLYRPCLCRMEDKVPNQSRKSNDFNHAAATTCVTSAQEQLMLIPDEPNAVGLLRVGPWISFRAHHMPQQADELLESAKKAVRWLHALGDENLAAARAWKLCNQMLREVARKIARKVDDLPEQPPKAAGPASDDVSMSSGAATQQHIYAGGHGSGQGQGLNFPPSSSIPYSNIAMTMAGIPGLGQFSSYDHIMQYDPYLEQSGIDPSQMQYQHSTNPMQYENIQAVSDAEMSFLNQYTDHPHDDPNGTGHRRPGFN